MNELEKPVMLIAALEDLARKSEGGFLDSETYADELAKREKNERAFPLQPCVVYEKASKRIVFDSLWDGDELEIVSYYDSCFPGVLFSVEEADDGTLYGNVDFIGGSGSIIIEKGYWHACLYS